MTLMQLIVPFMTAKELITVVIPLLAAMCYSGESQCGKSRYVIVTVRLPLQQYLLCSFHCHQPTTGSHRQAMSHLAQLASMI